MLTPNPNYGGTPKPYADADRRQHVHQLRRRAERDEERRARHHGRLRSVADRRRCRSLKSAGYRRLRRSRAGAGSAASTTSRTRPTTSTRSSRSCTSRQALAYLTDQPAFIKGIYKGAAVPAYGPIPSAPTSPYTPPNATNPPYPYNPAKAVSLLKAHGWKVVPNGQTTCAKAGQRRGRVRRRDPEGHAVQVRLGQPAGVGVVDRRARVRGARLEAKQAAGINITLQTKTFNFLVANYNEHQPGGGEVQERLGRQQLRRPVHGLLPDARTVSGTPRTGSTPAATRSDRRPT